MDFSGRIREFVMQHELIEKNDGIVVGVSGGADSVCLLLCLSELRKHFNLKLKAVHINHMIRGEEADRDQSFVEELCRELGVDEISVRINVPQLAKEKHLTEEEAGRNARYQTFKEVMEDSGFQKIAVAHNSDDLAETVIFNMARGSSIKGIAGIPVRRDCIIRPLLGVIRSEIEEYLKERGRSFVTDSTNLLDDYSRNSIRHTVIPALNKLNDRAVDHIAAAAEDVAEIYEMICDMADTAEIHFEEDRVKIATKSLEGLRGPVRREVYLRALEHLAGKRKDIGSVHLDSIDGLRSKENGSAADLPYGITAVKSYEKLIISGIGAGKKAEKEAEEKKDLFVEISGDGIYYTDNGEIQVKTMDYSLGTEIPSGDLVKMIDKDKVSGKMLLRYPRQEDRVKISAAGYKKLGRLFTDLKVEREDRKTAPVLADDNEIIWVIGRRLSEAFKVDSSTKSVYLLEYIQKNI